MPEIKPAADELVSVVVPARNEERHLGACLDSIRAQSYRNLQIIVVDGGSTDGTVDVAKQYMADDPRVELLVNPRQIIPVSLNLALAHARARWLVRVDAHATVGPDYVAVAVARLQEGRWGGVGGRKDGVGVTPAGRAIAAAMSSRFGVGGSTYHHGTTACEVEHVPFGSYPVELARSLGGWDERLKVNQDFEFDHRVGQSGHPLLFDPRMVIDWYCRQSIRDLYRQYRRYGQGKVTIAFLHPRSVRVRHLAPPAFVAWLVVAAVLAARRPGVSLAMVAPYGAALAAASAATARRLESPADRWRVAPAFAAMHIGWGLGFWSGLLTRLLPRR